jgi:hypothetical protein
LELGVDVISLGYWKNVDEIEEKDEDQAASNAEEEREEGVVVGGHENLEVG